MADIKFHLPDPPEYYWGDEEELEEEFEIHEEEPISDYYAPDYMDER